MRTSVKLPEDLIQDARDEAKAADRSIPSQIEHWARLGRTVEHLLLHDEVVALQRANSNAEDQHVPAGRRAIVAALRRVASDRTCPVLLSSIMENRPVYQDAGGGLVEQIDRDGTRRVGRFVNRRFTPEEPEAGTRANEQWWTGVIPES
jgi:hypothetical protein